MQTSTKEQPSEILSPEDENENEVRRDDQENINKFGRLNVRLHEVRYTILEKKKHLERIDDASTELMMGNGSNVMVQYGDTFFETSEDKVTNYCEAFSRCALVIELEPISHLSLMP